jgi:hypothetical protein
MARNGLGSASDLSIMSLVVEMTRFDESVRGGSVGLSRILGDEPDEGGGAMVELGGESCASESDLGTASLIHLLGLPGAALKLKGGAAVEVGVGVVERTFDSSLKIPLSRGRYLSISWQREATQASLSSSELQQRIWRDEGFISMTYAASPALEGFEVGLYSVITKEWR